MKTINRSAVIVKFKKPYVDWAMSMDGIDEGLDERMADTIGVYLLPEDEFGVEETPPIEKYFEEIFESELFSWCTDESLWPVKRDIETFYAWFDVWRESVIYDLAENKLVQED